MAMDMVGEHQFRVDNRRIFCVLSVLCGIVRRVIDLSAGGKSNKRRVTCNTAFSMVYNDYYSVDDIQSDARKQRV